MGGSALTPFYDLVHRLSGLGAVHAEMIRMAELAPGQRVLDIGCGTGNLLLALGSDHPGVEIEGLDPDPRPLARAACLHDQHVSTDRTSHSSNPCRIATRLDRLG